METTYMTIHRTDDGHPTKSITRPMTELEAADLAAGYSRRLYRSRAASRARLIALFGTAWWEDPRPENRWCLGQAATPGQITDRAA
jgi:hypothetical protein